MSPTESIEYTASTEYKVIQGDQINMAVFFLVACKKVSSVSYFIHVDTGQDTFYKVPENHGHVYQDNLLNTI